MQNPLKRPSSSYELERERLLENIKMHDPRSDDYHTVLTQIDKLDKIINRTTEFKKTVIPALGTIASVAGIYALQQFAGVIVPKALDALASRSTQKKSNED
jgi:hypothetical protein